MIINIPRKPTDKTKMTHWRGGVMEFATATRFTEICKPPWWVIRLINTEVWAAPWYYWIDYLGVPQIFLTRKMAERIAKELRQQYKCKVEVVKLELGQ